MVPKLKDYIKLSEDKVEERYPLGVLPSGFGKMLPFKKTMQLRTCIRFWVEHARDNMIPEGTLVKILKHIWARAIKDDSTWQDAARLAATLEELTDPLLVDLRHPDVFTTLDERFASSKQRKTQTVRTWMQKATELAAPLTPAFVDEWDLVRRIVNGLHKELQAAVPVLFEALCTFARVDTQEAALSAEQKAAMTLRALRELLETRANRAMVLSGEKAMGIDADKDDHEEAKKRPRKDRDGSPDGGQTDKGEKKDGKRGGARRRGKGAKDNKPVKRERSDGDSRSDATEKKAGAGDDRKKKIKCYNCQKMGHYASECRAPKKERKDEDDRKGDDSRKKKKEDSVEKAQPAPKYTKEELVKKREAFRARNARVEKEFDAAISESDQEDFTKVFHAVMRNAGDGGFGAYRVAVQAGSELASLDEMVQAWPSSTDGHTVELTENERRKTCATVVCTIGNGNTYTVVVMDTGCTGSSVLSQRHAEILEVPYEPFNGVVKGIADAAIVGRTGPVKVVIGRVTKELPFIVVQTEMDYPLICCGDVTAFGMPQFATDLRSLTTGDARFWRGKDSIFIPEWMMVGSPDETAANEERDDEGSVLSRMMRNNTLGPDDLARHARQEPTAHAVRHDPKEERSLHKLIAEKMPELKWSCWEDVPLAEGQQRLREELQHLSMPVEEPLEYLLTHATSGQQRKLHKVLQLMQENSALYACGPHPVMLNRHGEEVVVGPPLPPDANIRRMARQPKLSPSKQAAQEQAFNIGLEWGIYSPVGPDEDTKHTVRQVFAATGKGQWRMCIDPESNKKTEWVTSTAQRDEQARWVGREPQHLFFMANDDARKAFWTARLTREWQEYLTMEDVNGRRVRTDRMPFGLSWAPRAYNDQVEDLFATEPEMRKWMEVMVDNFLMLGTADDIDGFLDRCITFYTLCVKHRIPLSSSPDKRSFCRATTDFYGRKLGYRGTIEPTEVSLRKVLDEDAEFTDASTVRHTIGVAQWLAQFSNQITVALDPFRDLLKPGVDFVAAYNRERYDEHWRALQRIVATKLVRRRLVDRTLPAHTIHDANDTTMSTVLVQPSKYTLDMRSDPPEFFYICAMIAKKFSKAQRNWPAFSKELRAVLQGCGELHEEIDKCTEHVINSDHKPLLALTQTMLLGKLCARDQRALLLIHTLCAYWRYWPGKYNQLADTPTRYTVVHAPEGSKLIPMTRTVQEEHAVLMETESSAADARDNKVAALVAAQRMEAVYERRKDVLAAPRKREPLVMRVNDHVIDLQEVDLLSFGAYPGMVDINGLEIANADENDMAINLPVSLAQTCAKDPTTQIILALVDERPVPEGYDEKTVESARRLWEAHKDSWRIGGRTNAGTPLTLYHQGRNDFWPRRYLPAPLRKLYVRMWHGSLAAGHPQWKETLAALERVVFWEDWDAKYRISTMKTDVEKWVRTCLACQLGKPHGSTLNFEPGKPIPVTAPFSVCQIDIVGPFTETARGNRYIVSFTCYNTRFSLGAPIKTKEAKSVATFLLFIVVLVFGCPWLLTSDLGSEFCNRLMDEICRFLGIARHTTAADDPHGVARDERVHLTIENMMRTLALGDRWDLYVPAMFFAKNTRTNRMTGTTSFNAMFGRDPLNVADATLVGLALGELSLNEPQDFTVAQWSDRFAKHLQMRELKQAAHQLQLEATWNAQKGKGPRQQPVKVGELVALKATPYKTAIRGSKQAPVWIGPFTVTELSPNALRITGAYEPDPSIVVSRNANQWKRVTVDDDGEVLFDANAFDVEEILSARGPIEDRQYLVKWAGYPEEFNSWEPRVQFAKGSINLLREADERWPATDELAEADEPMPTPAVSTPEWAADLTLDKVERFISVDRSRRGGLTLRVLLKPTKRRQAEHDRTRTIAVSLLPVAIRDSLEVVRLVEKAMR